MNKTELTRDIMNIPVDKYKQDKAIFQAMTASYTYTGILDAIYQLGHRDARHAACDILDSFAESTTDKD